MGGPTPSEQSFNYRHHKLDFRFPVLNCPLASHLAQQGFRTRPNLPSAAFAVQGSGACTHATVTHFGDARCPSGPHHGVTNQTTEDTPMKLYITTISALARLAEKQRGATMPEYGLMVALIAVVCIAAVTALGTSLSTIFTTIGNAIAAAN